MPQLSVNLNKVALLRNSRTLGIPSVLEAARTCIDAGAAGITVHPRPDERHIRYQDAYDLKSVVTTEYNIEGNPIPKFLDMVLELKQTQVTLVPDAVDAVRLAVAAADESDLVLVTGSFYVLSAGRAARCMPNNSSPWLPVSTKERPRASA